MAKVRCNNHRCVYNKRAYEEEMYGECTLDNLVFLDSHGECEEVEYADKEECR
jgi:hypothetical protein